jgi:hypothetical protein
LPKINRRKIILPKSNFLEIIKYNKNKKSSSEHFLGIMGLKIKVYTKSPKFNITRKFPALKTALHSRCNFNR